MSRSAADYEQEIDILRRRTQQLEKQLSERQQINWAHEVEILRNANHELRYLLSEKSTDFNTLFNQHVSMLDISVSVLEMVVKIVNIEAVGKVLDALRSMRSKYLIDGEPAHENLEKLTPIPDIKLLN